MSQKGLCVVSAAIRDTDGKVYSVPPPGRHKDVIKLMHDKGLPCPPLANQGFLLSDGRFCNRKAAKIIAIKANQLTPRAMNLPELYSEDVW